MMIEDFKKGKNNTQKCRRTQVNGYKPLKRKYKIPLKIYRKSNQTFQRSLAWPGARVLAKERECRQGGEVASPLPLLLLLLLLPFLLYLASQLLPLARLSLYRQSTCLLALVALVYHTLASPLQRQGLLVGVSSGSLCWASAPHTLSPASSELPW